MDISHVDFNEVVMQDAAAATGDGTALDMRSKRYATIQVKGTFMATITWKASCDDGTTYADIQAVPLADTATPATTATAAGIYRIGPIMCDKILADITAYTSGNVTALGRASA